MLMRAVHADHAPLLQLGDRDGIWLNPGESLHNNINLAFGSAGFPLAEPGEYLITPVLTLFNGRPDPIDPEKEPVLTVVKGKSLPISIMPPVSKGQRRDADLVLRNDVGASLALGGADCLTTAADTLHPFSTGGAAMTAAENPTAW